MVCPSQEAKDYKAAVKWRALHQKLKPLECNVAVSVTIYRPIKSGDLDNRLKPLLDSLRGIAYVDDKQVVELHALRLDDAANPRAVVTVEPQVQDTTPTDLGTKGNP
jgi:Holliday junction resolvase RusA-like endonuclease